MRAVGLSLQANHRWIWTSLLLVKVGRLLAIHDSHIYGSIFCSSLVCLCHMITYSVTTQNTCFSLPSPGFTGVCWILCLPLFTLLSLSGGLRIPLPTHCYLAREEKYSIARNTEQSETGAYFTQGFIDFYCRICIGNTIAHPIYWIIFNIIPGIWNYLVILSWFLWLSMSWTHTACLNIFIML